jgi:hypothetical protein
MITKNEDSITIECENLDAFISREDLRSIKSQLMDLQGQIQEIANYAEAKANAMELREKGNVKLALVYDAICEKVYFNLPAWAKW